MARTVVGLEITEESVRAAELTQGRKPQLIAFGEVPLPPEAARDSEVLDPGAVAVALRQLWTGARFKSKNVVLGVASRRILVREYTTQAMRPDLLREALPYQVQDLLPVPASQAVLDFYPLTQEGDQVSGLLVAAVSDTIEQIIATLARVKARVTAVDLGAFALARATAPLVPPGATTATVFIGDHTTQVVVTRDGAPLFVRILPIDVATSAVRRHQEQLAVDSALEMAGVGTGRTRGSLRATAAPPGVADLAARLRSTLAFYTNRGNAQPLSQILLTGSGVTAEGVLPALGAAIDTPLSVVSTENVVTSSGTLPDGELALDLVSTVGLALGEARR